MDNYTKQFDKDFKENHRLHFSKSPFDWRMLKAQAIAESNLNPLAVSPVSAKGLMQLMPKTFEELVNKLFPSAHIFDDSVFDVALNVTCGVYYVSWLYERFSEIPDPIERYKFALAAYNAGRGNINKALEIARDDEGLPGRYKQWLKRGQPAGDWQHWENTKAYLFDVTGKYSFETVDYVKRIFDIYKDLTGGAK